MESSKKEAIVHRTPRDDRCPGLRRHPRAVKILMDHLAAGNSLDEFLEDFPSVSREQAVAYREMAREAAESASVEDGSIGRRSSATGGDGGGRAR
jgi:hypothetical protein